MLQKIEQNLKNKVKSNETLFWLVTSLREKVGLRKRTYFFIIGAARGGTTLLSAMLDCHPELRVGFERFATDYLWAEKFKEGKKASLMKRINTFKRACTKLSYTSDLYWGNKIVEVQIRALFQAPGATSKAEVVKAFSDKVLKNRKVIFLVRDGRHCVRSKLNRENKDYTTALHTWKFSIELYNMLEEHGIEQCLVRYEDLVSNPKKELERICLFLGVPYREEMLQAPNHRAMPDAYKGGKGIRSVPPLTDEQSSWTADMEVELKQLGYLDEN